MTLKELRLKTGLRQEDVAKALDVDQTAVSYWETGKTRPCRKYHAKLAKLYGCTVDELLRDARQSDTSKGGWNNATENAGRY